MNNKILLLKTQLAQFLGVEVEDISNEDDFIDDLHMQPTDLSDLIHNLKNTGFDVPDIDLTTIATVGDLIEALEIEDSE